MRPEPLRFQIARDFLAAARDMGDAQMIAAARRIWDATCYPRTNPATDADMAIFAAWQEEC